jgi:hypothetical protein
MFEMSQPQNTPVGSTATGQLKDPGSVNANPQNGKPANQSGVLPRRSPRRAAPDSASLGFSPDEDPQETDMFDLDEDALDDLMTSEIETMLLDATPQTKIVDRDVKERIGNTRLFCEIYFAHGKRTIQVSDGPKLTAYKCLCGCVHPKGEEWYTIKSKQSSQAIYDHLCSQKHVGNCQVDLSDSRATLKGYMAYMRKLVPRLGRWGRDGNKESRSKVRAYPRSTGRKVPKLAANDPTVVALFQDKSSIVTHCLNSLGPLGQVMSQGQQAELTSQLEAKKTRTH